MDHGGIPIDSYAVQPEQYNYGETTLLPTARIRHCLCCMVYFVERMFDGRRICTLHGAIAATVHGGWCTFKSSNIATRAKQRARHAVRGKSGSGTFRWRERGWQRVGGLCCNALSDAISTFQVSPWSEGSRPSTPTPTGPTGSPRCPSKVKHRELRGGGRSSLIKRFMERVKWEPSLGGGCPGGRVLQCSGFRDVFRCNNDAVLG
jgi:hypothetical protein